MTTKLDETLATLHYLRGICDDPDRRTPGWDLRVMNQAVQAYIDYHTMPGHVPDSVTNLFVELLIAQFKDLSDPLENENYSVQHDPSETCLSCKFSHDTDSTCRLHPPIRLPRRFTGMEGRERHEEVQWAWPETLENDWCGQWVEHPTITMHDHERKLRQVKTNR